MPGNEPIIAVKELRSTEPELFRAESSMLNTLRILNHPHLVKLIATYQIGQSYCLMFPWADGNLRDFWNRDDTNPLTSKSIEWVLQQMVGLCDALKELHNFEPDHKPAANLEANPGSSS